MPSKCSVAVTSTGPGGLVQHRACGRPAIRRFGHRNYCAEHAGQERQRLHLDALESGARIRLERTMDGTSCVLEPHGIAVRSNVFHELTALGWLTPEADPLFPNLEWSAQSWRLVPGAAR